MANIRTIRNVDEDTWSELKSLSRRYKLPIGRLLNRVINKYKTKSDSLWDTILNHEKILSDKEAEAMQEFVKKLRNEYGFRK